MIVNYEVEATVLGDTGEAIVAERKSNQKRIRLRALDEHTDVSRLVDEILERCKLIHESKRPLVERLLRDLQDQQAQGAPVRGARAAASADEPVAGSEVARLERLGEYIDGCYEGTAQAVRATGLLLQLAREPAQLEALVHDERLLGCLTRLLGDEGKACADLSLNAASVLYALSAFSDFHPQLLGAKVGSLLMDVVDLEIKRHALRERDRAAAPASEAPAEARRARAAGKASERLLYVCLHLLLNLSEDVHTERKMSAHGLVPMLVALLARQNADLLILCFAFLKKLSAFSENAEQMAKARLADKLVAFVPNRHDGVLEQALRLAHNLALHHRCAAQLGRAGLSAKLLSLLRKGRHRLLAVRLLCALSARDDERPKMTASVPMLVGTVINTPDPALIPPEVLALLVNLATNLDNARALARARGALRSFVALGCAAQQPLALKLLRNLALHAGEAHCEELARAHGAELLALPAAAASADVQLEALGLLADLPLSALGDGGAELLEASGALGVAAAALDAHSGAEDDAVLEAARFLAAAAGHAGCAALLGADCELLGLLCGALSAWEEEDEIVLAATHALLRLMAGSRVRARAQRRTEPRARSDRAHRAPSPPTGNAPARRRRASGCSPRASWSRSCSTCSRTSARRSATSPPLR